MSNAELIQEALEHSYSTGPNRGVSMADGVFGTPLGEVLRSESLLVQKLARALAEAEGKLQAVQAVLDIPKPTEKDFTASQAYIKGALDTQLWWRTKIGGALGG